MDDWHAFGDDGPPFAKSGEVPRDPAATVFPFMGDFPRMGEADAALWANWERRGAFLSSLSSSLAETEPE